MNTRTLTVSLKANVAGLRAGLAAGAAEVRGFGNDVEKAALSTTQSTDKIGKGFLVVGGVISAALGASVVAASQFEASMRNVATISTYVGANFDAVGGKLIAMSNRLPQSANELAQGLYDVASSGFAGADGLKVVEASASAASAGLSTTATAGKAITGVLNAYGLSADQARGVSDVLFQTVNLGVVTFDELAQNLGDVVGLASSAKIPIKDVGAAIASITLAGVPAAEATTSLNRVIQSLLQPSDGLIEKFHSWGFASGEAALNSLGLEGVMLRLRKEVGSSATAWLQLFPEIRAARGALALTAADGENYTRVSKGMSDATRGVGATQRALAEQAKSLQYQLGILKNEVVNTAIEFGTAMLPALKLIVGGAKAVVETFSGMPGPVRTGVVVLAAISAAALIVGGSFLLLFARLGRLRAELIGIGPAGERAAAGLGMLGRATALAAGLGAVAYGISAIGTSTEGTIAGILSLVSGIGLLKAGLPGLQGALQSISQNLTAQTQPSLVSAGVGVGKMAEGVGRLSKVAPGLAISGGIMAASMDHMGEASVGGAVNMLSMAATGAQLGFVLGGPVGAAIGGTAGLIAGPLASALGIGGESVDDYRKKFVELGDAIDRVGQKQALKLFVDKLGDTDKLHLFAGDVKAIKNEIESVAQKSPAAALKIIDSLKGSAFAANLTAKDYDYLRGRVEATVAAQAKEDARAEKSKANNEKIRAAHKEVTAAAAQMSEAEQAAAESTSKALDQIAQAATSSLPTAKTAFDQIQQAAASFGVEMDPAILLQGFQDKLKAQLDFGSNLTVIMRAGFVDIGNVVAQEGPDAGGKIAQALADGIRAGDPAVVEQLNQTAKALGVVAPTIEQEFKSTWGPAIMRGQADAFSSMSPYVRQLLGIDIPAEIAGTAPQFGFSGEVAAAATVAGVVSGLAPLPSTGSFYGELAAAATVAAAASGLAPLPAAMTGAAGSGAAGAAGAVTAGGAQIEAASTEAGQKGAQGLETGLAGMKDKVDGAIGGAVGSLVLSAATLSGVAVSSGVVIGNAFATGIASGIAQGSAGVQTAAARVVSDAETAAKEKAGIKSPSRLFAGIGRNLAAGVAVGIAQGTNDVLRASGGLVAAPTLPAFGQSIAPGPIVGSGGGALVVNVTSTIEGNVYGDQAFKDKVDKHLDDSNRKLATALRRNRG